MQYDLVISDFDGTLLRSDDTISARTVAAVQAFAAAGGVFGVSTGRAFSSIRKRLGELGLRGKIPVMCCQGALARDCESGEILSEIPMPGASAAEFLRRAEKAGLAAQFYTADEVFIPHPTPQSDMYFERNRITPRIVGDAAAHAETCGEPIIKVLAFIDPRDRDKHLALLGGIAGCTVMASAPVLVEAVSQNAGKGNGLRLACKRMGIDIMRAVAIGDEQNDIGMIEAAGLGVAVGNAIEAVKRAADYVTDECDRDGVAHVLEKITAGEPFEKERRK